ncbi:MAG UNVERIFIED_CONTAM: hypothetical protein LVR29_16470 [Microcystis novacekii LVE1205-3]|jgi:hypothetical protein
MKLLKTLIGTFLILPIFSVHAQVPSLPQSSKIPPILVTYRMIPPSRKIGFVTEESNALPWLPKEEKGWKELIEKQGWQLVKEIPIYPIKLSSFSCEPEQTLGILTVYWLNGSNGQQQLSQWSR